MKKSSRGLQRKTLTFNSGISTIPAGNTRYVDIADSFADGGLSAGMGTRNEYYCTYSGIIKNLMVRSNAAPGAGETFVYTVMVNGLATAITCTTSGAVNVRSSDLINSVAVSIGDRISIRAVNSAGGAATEHSAFLLLT